ncbi:uncharacterized protein LTHEOB_6650 [Lasiodiplodia theobromae]|uniref:uncharacterized protein n=1 Tax=Lasiodiplodia theobromae TaxID=45133 RepID=UPI0015C38542|nr:uncharacterized protein LTHEOB_6650 [Lasiodiplodia theobromae]KAF4543984.1 hypothetical protein LTHEOB_6650 [Lasiodiplodia theobromae]
MSGPEIVRHPATAAASATVGAASSSPPKTRTAEKDRLVVASAIAHVSAATTVLTNTTAPLPARPGLHHHAQASPTPSGVSPGLHAAALGSVATVPQPAPTVLPAETTTLLPRHTLGTWQADATTTTDGPAAPPLDSATTASTTAAAATATVGAVSSDLPRVQQQGSAGIRPLPSSVDLGAETATTPAVPTTPRHDDDDGRHHTRHRRRMPSVSSQRGLMRLRTAGAAVEAPSSARKAPSASFDSDEPSSGTLSTHGTLWAAGGNSVGEPVSSSSRTKRGTGEIGRAKNRVPATPLRVRLTPLAREQQLLGGADERGGDGDGDEQVQRQNNSEEKSPSLLLQRMRTGCGESLMITLSPSPSPPQQLMQPSPFPSPSLPSRKRRMGPENGGDDDDDDDEEEEEEDGGHDNNDTLAQDEAGQSHHLQQPRSSRRRSVPQPPLTKRAKLSRSDFSSSPSNSPLTMTNKDALSFPTQESDDDNTDVAVPSTPIRSRMIMHQPLQQQHQTSTVSKQQKSSRRNLYAANIDAGGGSFALTQLPRVGPPPQSAEHEQLLLRHVSTASAASSDSYSSSVGSLPGFPSGYFFGALNEAVEALAPFMAAGRGTSSENTGPQGAGSEGDGTIIKNMVVDEANEEDDEIGGE